MQYSGISCVTTLLGEIIDFLPIVTPAIIIAPGFMTTPDFITTLEFFLGKSPCF